MRLNVFSHTLREARQPILRWTIVLAAVAWVLLLLHPLLLLIFGRSAFAGPLPGPLAFLFGGETAAPGLEEADGWFTRLGLDLLLPLLVVVFTVRQGSWLIAGEEERGSLGLLLAATVSRSRLVVEKIAVLVLGTFVPAAALLVVLLPAAWTGLLPLGGGQLVRAWVGLWLLGLDYGGLALALGAFTGRQWVSQAAAYGLALLSLVLFRLPDTLPGQAVLRWFSPFLYYSQIHSGQFVWLGILVLLVLALLACAAAWAAFNRRDLPV